MRRILVTLLTMLTVSGALAAAPIANAAVVPGTYTSGPVCSASGNACELIYNQAQGSDFVIMVQVYDNQDQSLESTYRVLFDGSVRYTATGPGIAVFNLNYNVDPKRCIQGGIEG